MVGLDTFYGLSRLGLCILDDMALVENTVMPLDNLQIGDVVVDDLVGGDYNIILG